MLIRVADFTDTLTIVINEDQPEHTATFTVPQTLLTEKAEFFRAACRNEWQEASTRIVKIPEVNVGAFKAYIHWIYKEKVAVRSQHALAGHSYNTAVAQPVLYDLVHLWLLADRLADTQLRNFAINAMLRVMIQAYTSDQDWTAAITPDMITLVWSKSTSGRALRRLIVDLYARSVKAEHLERVREELHPEFIKDLMIKFIRVRDEKDVIGIFYGSACYYHEHEEHEAQCCRYGALGLTGLSEGLWDSVRTSVGE